MARYTKLNTDDIEDSAPRFGLRGSGTEAGPEGLQYLAVGAPVSDAGDSEIEQGWWSD